MRYALLALFAAVAAGANYATSHLGMVPIGFGLMVTAGTFFAGVALVLRDAIHEKGGARLALVAVVLGVALSFLTSSPAIAVASALAFLVSEGVDGVIYGALRSRGRALAVLASGAAGLVLDTVVFLYVAGFPVTVGAIVGQSLVKGAFTVAVAAYLAKRKR